MRKSCLTDKAPSLEDLPKDYRMGYAFYENQLYFINRYEQLITPLTQSNHTAKFRVYLARFHELSDVPSDIQTPMIIKTDDGCYTFFPGKTPINASMIDVNFPSEMQRIISCSESNIPEVIFKEIARTGFKAPSFSELFKEKFSDSKTLSADELGFIDIHTGHSYMLEYSRVPKDLRKEIELLWQLFHNPAKNIEATRNIATCIGIRGEEIRRMTKQYERELIQIGINPEEKCRLLEDAKVNLETQLETFNTKPHPGSDKHLGLTNDILNHYQKTLSIQSLRDCYFLSAFQARDLSMILENHPSLIESLNNQLSNIEEFSVYLSETPLATLDVILPYTIKILKNHLNTLPALLEMIGPEKNALVIKHFANIIKSVADFNYVTARLNPAQRTQLFEALKDHWPSLIKIGWDFNDAVRYLDPAQRTQVFDALKYHWPRLIESVEDFNFATEYLNHAQCTKLIEILKDHWLGIIKSGWDFNLVIQYLKPEQRTQLIDILKNHWQGIIKSGMDFNFVFKNLDPAQRTQLIEILKGHWPSLIKSGEDLNYVIEGLNPAQRTQLMKILKVHWPDIITSAIDFNDATARLDPAQRTQVFDALKNHWPSLIRSGADFNHIIEDLNPAKRTQLMEILKGHWPDIITSAMDFRNVTAFLDPAQRTQVIEELNQGWIGVIQQSKGDKTFQQTIYDLSVKERNDIWGDIHELRATIIDLADGIRGLSKYCKSKDIEHFLDAMVNQDSSQINKAFNTLSNSTMHPRKSFLFSSFNFQFDHNSKISKIVREKFPDFCVKHIVDFAGPELKKIESRPK